MSTAVDREDVRANATVPSYYAGWEKYAPVLAPAASGSAPSAWVGSLRERRNDHNGDATPARGNEAASHGT